MAGVEGDDVYKWSRVILKKYYAHTYVCVCVCVSLYIMKLGQRARQRGNDRAKEPKHERYMGVFVLVLKLFC